MKRWFILLAAVCLLAAAPLYMIESPLHGRVIAIVAVCLFIWITELAPPFVPTLILWASVPLIVFPIDARFSMPAVLGWAADPVMALFFGGFSLGLAAEVCGLDKRLASFALRSAGRSFGLFLILVVLITAFFSMWLSNIAAASLVLACLRPVLREFHDEHILRRTLLIGVALGADFGGMATPIGTGPNAIAIAWLTPGLHISFLDWMIFAFPLTVGMLVLGSAILLFRARSETKAWSNRDSNLTAQEKTERVNAPGVNEKALGLIMSATVILWLSEPLHKVPAAVVAIATAATLFLSGILRKKDLFRLDWSTLLLKIGRAHV